MSVSFYQHSHIQQRNNTAIVQWRKGNLNGAMNIMKQALSSLKSKLGNDRKQHHNDRRPSHDAGHFYIRSVPMVSEQVEHNLTLMSPKNLFSFYPRAFVFYDNDAKDELISDDACDCSLILMMLFYNLALSYHSAAASQGDPRELRTAQMLYQSALDIARSSWGKVYEDNDFFHQSYMTLLMAITNNMGWCHSHMMNFTETKQCLCLLNDLLDRSHLDDNVSEDNGETEDYEIFLDAAMAVFDGRGLSVAPAA